MIPHTSQVSSVKFRDQWYSLGIPAEASSNVEAFVCFTAFVPEVGETLPGILESFPPGFLSAALRPTECSPGEVKEPGHEFSITVDMYKDASHSSAVLQPKTVVDFIPSAINSVSSLANIGLETKNHSSA